MASGTPSAQVRIPLTGPLLPPPTYAHTILFAEKVIRRRKNYPGRAKVGRKFEKKPHRVAQCRKCPIPYIQTLSQTTPYLYKLNRTIPYLYTLTRTIPYLNTLRKTPNLAQNQILVGSQPESSTKEP